MDGFPDLPPLLDGVALAPGVDPLAAAVEAGRAGGDPGFFALSMDPSTVDLGVLLAPEEPLETALLAAIALQQAATDALGALGPPEMAVMWAWPDALLVNGATAGRLRATAPEGALSATPDWLALGLTIAIAPPDQPGVEPGAQADRTALALEGAGDLPAAELGAAVGRHFVRWLHHYESDGPRSLIEAWSARAVGRAAPVRLDAPGGPQEGVLLGLDEAGGLLLKQATTTSAAPLRLLLNRSRATEIRPMLQVLARETTP